MYAKFKKVIFGSGIVLSTLVPGISFAADSVSQEVTAARQEAQIWTTYALSPYLRAHDLKVSVHNGTATLSGIVDEDVNRDLAKQIALGVSGIRDVDNQIVVQADSAPRVRSSDRSYGELIDDATITAEVKSKLMWSKHADGLATEVDTKYGKVTLAGTANSGAAKDLAGRLALNTRGVVSVDNQLVVSGSKPGVAEGVKHSADQAERNISDSWITTKVKSTFMYSSNVNGSNIDVATAGGTVTLSGTVNSGAERALAIELASNVRGVKNVNAQKLTVLK